MLWKSKPTPESILIESLKKAASNPDAWIPCKDDRNDYRSNLLFGEDIQITHLGTAYKLNGKVWHKLNLTVKQCKEVSRIYDAILAEQATRNIERKLDGLKQ